MGMKMYKKQGVPQVASFVLVAGFNRSINTGATTSKPLYCALIYQPNYNFRI